jgi:hypothetical protein
MPALLDFVGTIAWPIVVVVLALIFKSQVAQLLEAVAKRLGKLTRLKVGWGEAEWSDREVEEVAEDVGERAAGEPSTKADPEEVEADIAIQLARIQPSAGVIAAFIELEREVGHYLTAHGIGWSGSPIVAMRRAPNVPKDLAKLVGRLAYLRNAAAHGQSDVSFESAVEYIDATEQLARQVEHLTAQQTASSTS